MKSFCYRCVYFCISPVSNHIVNLSYIQTERGEHVICSICMMLSKNMNATPSQITIDNVEYDIVFRSLFKTFKYINVDETTSIYFLQIDDIGLMLLLIEV